VCERPGRCQSGRVPEVDRLGEHTLAAPDLNDCPVVVEVQRELPELSAAQHVVRLV